MNLDPNPTQNDPDAVWCGCSDKTVQEFKRDNDFPIDQPLNEWFRAILRDEVEKATKPQTDVTRPPEPPRGTAEHVAWQMGWHDLKFTTEPQPPAKPKQAQPPAPMPPAEAPYRVLGWCASRQRIHYQHRTTGQIADIAPQAQSSTLLKLAPLSYWETMFPGARGVDWNSAISSVIETADAAGVFCPERLRGRGVWIDNNRIVWHLGDRLEVDGKTVPLIDFSSQSAFYYQRLAKLDIDPAAAPLADQQGRQILQTVAAMGWGSPVDSLHLLGWAVLANVGSALEHRPWLQITSHHGSGKSHTLKFVLEPLLAGLALSESNSTEASVRQNLNTDTVPVLLDESESEDHQRREGHIRLARLSYDGKSTSKGSQHGKAVTYAVRSSFALVGINATIANAADRSRAVVVSRNPIPAAQWAQVDQQLRQLLTVATGAQLLRRTVTHLHTLRANVATFRLVVESQLRGGTAARAGDTYGALVAGAHHLSSTDRLTPERAVAWLDEVGWSAAAALGEDAAQGANAAAEGEDCLNRLLGFQETWKDDHQGTGRITVLELLQLARVPGYKPEQESARAALGRLGIKATDQGLVVSNNGEHVRPIYSQTKWRDGAHLQRLRDLPGAAAAGVQHFKVVGSHKATTIPWSALGF